MHVSAHAVSDRTEPRLSRTRLLLLLIAGVAALLTLAACGKVDNSTEIAADGSGVQTLTVTISEGDMEKIDGGAETVEATIQENTPGLSYEGMTKDGTDTVFTMALEFADAEDYAAKAQPVLAAAWADEDGRGDVHAAEPTVQPRVHPHPQLHRRRPHPLGREGAGRRGQDRGRERERHRQRTGAGRGHGDGRRRRPGADHLREPGQRRGLEQRGLRRLRQREGRDHAARRTPPRTPTPAPSPTSCSVRRTWTRRTTSTPSSSPRPRTAAS